MLTVEDLPRLQDAIADAGVDGWLLYNFRGLNPIATGLLGLPGMLTRRIFAYIPREGRPVAITHAIEQGPWAQWPAGWSREVYSSWPDLEAHVARLVRGKTVAMEYSPGDAVPYLDRVPAGVLELVRAAGGIPVSSSDLVSRFYAVWTAAGLASHRRAAEHLARIAREAFGRAGASVRDGAALAEHDVQRWILAQFASAGLTTDHGPNVSASEHAANPHYEPSPSAPRVLRQGDVLLIDLWATEADGVYADQTWMGTIGAPSERAQQVWTAVRDARDAALALLKERIGTGAPVTGAEVDDAARAVITSAGFGPHFTHRTGHSIDERDLHGSGPNLDNLETRDARRLLPGVAFSVEPGVYLAGELGVRSEVNCIVGDGELLITPGDIQRDLFVV